MGQDDASPDDLRTRGSDQVFRDALQLIGFGRHAEVMDIEQLTGLDAQWAKGTNLHPDNAARNQLLGCLRAQGERGIALLKTRWKALNRIRLCPQRIGAIVKAALVLTNAERPIR